MTAVIDHSVPVGLARGPTERRFDPYSDNGGTILAVSSDEFCIIASDTRQSEGYTIQTRYQPRIHQLSDEFVIAIAGFMADANTLVKKLKQHLEWYRHTHARYPDLQATARLVQTMLYGKRFFPYYAWVILGGIDRDGTGAVYSFDPVGSYERTSCRAYGAAQSLLQPFLDSQISKKNQVLEEGEQRPGFYHRAQVPLDRTLALVTDAFTGATERQIYVGDMMELYVVKIVEGLGEHDKKKRKVTMEVIRKDLKKD